MFKSKKLCTYLTPLMLIEKAKTHALFESHVWNWKIANGTYVVSWQITIQLSGWDEDILYAFETWENIS